MRYRIVYFFLCGLCTSSLSVRDEWPPLFWITGVDGVIWGRIENVVSDEVKKLDTNLAAEQRRQAQALKINLEVMERLLTRK